MKKLIKPTEPIICKSLDKIESFIHTHPKVNFLFGAIFGAFDGLLRSAKETTRTQPFIRNNYDVKRFMGAVLVALVIGWVLPTTYFFWWQCVVSKLLVSFIIGVFVFDVFLAFLMWDARNIGGGF